MDGGVARCLSTYLLGSIAQGAPFVLVAAELERRGVGTNWLAAVAAVRLAPYLLCSPFAGALAGRYEARTVFAVTGLARAALIAALWIALSAGSPALLLVSLLFVLVAVGTPTFPALMRAVRQRAPHARLDRTSALAAGLESAAFVAGPALGGLLLLRRHHGLAARVRRDHGGVGDDRLVRPDRRDGQPASGRTVESDSFATPVDACSVPQSDR